MSSDSPKPPNFAPPRWLGWTCFGLLLLGLFLFVGGPMLSLAAARWQAEQTLTPEEWRNPKAQRAAVEKTLEIRRKSDAWVLPVGMYLTGVSTLGLLFIFVTRPLGSDLDEPVSSSD